MANGQPYHAAALTAASRTFRIGTDVTVHSLQTGTNVVVTITDTVPWVDKFKIDLSLQAFLSLGLAESQGWGWVTVTRCKGAK